MTTWVGAICCGTEYPLLDVGRSVGPGAMLWPSEKRDLRAAVKGVRCDHCGRDLGQNVALPVAGPK